jgi:hypothetical protein
MAEFSQNLVVAELEHIITYTYHILIDIPHERIRYDKFNLLKNEDVYY